MLYLKQVAHITRPTKNKIHSHLLWSRYFASTKRKNVETKAPKNTATSTKNTASSDKAMTHVRNILKSATWRKNTQDSYHQQRPSPRTRIGNRTTDKIHHCDMQLWKNMQVTDNTAKKKAGLSLENWYLTGLFPSSGLSSRSFSFKWSFFAVFFLKVVFLCGLVVFFFLIFK